MKIALLLFLLYGLHFLSAQDSLVDLEERLKMEYSTDNLDDLILLGQILPIRVPVDSVGSEDWIKARKKCVELYLMWYQNMFASRFNLNDKSRLISSEASIAKLETEDQKKAAVNMNARNMQRNNAIATFLIAEQRLKFFTRKSFKAKKRQKIKEMLVTFEESYDMTIGKILDDVLVREVGFTIYENRVVPQCPVDFENPK